MGYGFHCRWNFKAAQIGAAKDVSRVRRRRQQAHLDFNSCVQPYAVSFNAGTESGLLNQGDVLQRLVFEL